MPITLSTVGAIRLKVISGPKLLAEHLLVLVRPLMPGDEVEVFLRVLPPIVGMPAVRPVPGLRREKEAVGRARLDLADV